MAQSFFIWNGIDCRSKGVIMRGPAAIVRAEERVKHVEIPGREGDLTETEGAMQALGELTGRSVREDVTNRIFARFCVGK